MIVRFSVLILLVTIISFQHLHAQDKDYVEDLQKQLDEAEGEDRVKILVRLAGYFLQADPDKSLSYCGEIIDMGRRLNDPAIVARGLVEKANYFRRKDLPDSAKSLLNEAEEMSRNISNHNLQGILNQRIGILYREQRKMDSSIIYFNRSLTHYKNAGDQFQYAQTLDQMSGTYIDKGDMETAKACLDESISILDVLMKKDSSYATVREAAVAISHLGNFYMRKGNYERALEANLKSLRFFERTGEVRAQATALYTIGITYRRLLKSLVAIPYYRKAAEYYSRVGEESGISVSMEGIGMCFSEILEKDSSMTRYNDSALLYFDKALVIARKIKNKLREANILNNTGAHYHRMKDYKKAAEHYQRSFDLRGGLNSTNHVFLSTGLINLGNTYLNTGDLNMAGKYLLLGLHYAKEIGSKEHQKSALEGLVEYYTVIKDHKKANEYLNELIIVKDSLYAVESEEKIAEMQVKYETEKKEQEIALLKAENRYSTLKQIALGSGIAISVLVGLLLYRSQKNKKGRVLAELAVAREKEHAAEAQLKFKNREILNFAVQITEKNDLLESVGREIEKMRAYREQSPENVDDIVTLLREHLNMSGDRQEFEAHVSNVYDSFIKRLEEKYPELTAHEKRLATLLRINLSSKEIASVFNISAKSVDMNRYRLRKKMGLDGEQNLTDVLNSI